MKNLYFIFLFSAISMKIFAIDAPSITLPSNGATNQNLTLSLDWTDITGNEGYIYQLDTVSDFSSSYMMQDTTSTNVSYVNISNLYFGTTYYWRVLTLSSSGNSVWSASWSFTTYYTVNNLYPTNGATNINITMNIDWSDITGNNGYIWQMDTTPNFNSSLFTQGTTATNNSFENQFNLLFGTTFYWRVCAKSVIDTSDWSETWSFTTRSTVNNTYPTNGVTNMFLSLYIDWSDITGNSGYIWQMDTTPNFNSSLFTQGTTSTNSSFENQSNLLFGTTYYWHACAKSVSDTSDWSETWSFTTRSTVNNTSPSDGAIDQDTTLNLDWTDFTGNDGYIYQIDTSQNFNSSLLQQGATIQNNSFVGISGLLYGTIYYWHACVKSINDTSDWSNTTYFKTSYQLTNAPDLISPVDCSIGISYVSTDLEWSSIPEATAYQYQYSQDSTFNSGIYNGTTGSLTETINNLNQTTTYFWRVRGQNSSGYSPWSTIWKFTTDNNVGISDLSDISSIKIFPNPISNILTIIGKGIITVEITNYNGQIIDSKIVKNNMYSFDLSNISSGIYLIKVATDKNIIYKKVIKK